MKNLLSFPLLALVAAVAGCASTETMPEEIYVHSEQQLSNAFLPWRPANPRSLAGSYQGEMGDTIERAHLTVDDGGKHVMIGGRLVTATVEGAPIEKPINPTRLETGTPPSIRIDGESILFVTYLDPLATVFKRPVNGLIRHGLFYAKESELE